MPQRPVRGAAAVSTASPGTVNSAVAVDPSVTVMEVGSKVMVLTVVVGQGFVTVKL